jgi:hypothetical protein
MVQAWKHTLGHEEGTLSRPGGVLGENKVTFKIPNTSHSKYILGVIKKMVSLYQQQVCFPLHPVQDKRNLFSFLH